MNVINSELMVNLKQNWIDEVNLLGSVSCFSECNILIPSSILASKSEYKMTPTECIEKI